MSRPLEGKVALVTGASRVIGRAIAKRLGKDGARIVVNYYPNRPADDEEARARDVARGIEESGSRAVVAEADVANPERLRGLFDLAEQQFGALDLLVHNAAAMRSGPIVDATDADFDLVFNTNTRAAFVAMREAARRLRNGGRIIMISAGFAIQTRAGSGIYAASKAATDQLARVLSHEVGPRQITVNSVLPGPTNTDATNEKIARENAYDWLATEIAATPLRRIGEPEDIADIVAFLASDAARWVTGQSIGAGGGLF